MRKLPIGSPIGLWIVEPTCRVKVYTSSKIEDKNKPAKNSSLDRSDLIRFLKIANLNTRSKSIK